MNKRLYVSILCILGMILSVIGVIGSGRIPMDFLPQGMGSQLLQIVIFSIFSMIIVGMQVELGMYFAQAVGAPLLLLQRDFRLKEDILKPAIVVGGVCGFVLLFANQFVSIDLFPEYFFKNFFHNKYSHFFSYKMLIYVLGSVADSTALLLLFISGLGLLISSIAKNISINLVMLISILLYSLLSSMHQVFFATAGISMISLGIRMCLDIIRAVIFWKKGFETAVLCHLIIVFMYYLLPAGISVLKVSYITQ